MQGQKVTEKDKTRRAFQTLFEGVYDWLPRPRIAREGWGLAAVLLMETLLWHFLQRKFKFLRPVRNFAAVATALIAFFYRDPARFPLGSAKDYFYAPADGKVTKVDAIDEPKFIGGRAHRIVIEGRLWDVHLQRAPFASQLRYVFLESTPNSILYTGFADSNGVKVLVAIEPKEWPLPKTLRAKRPGSLRVEVGSSLGVAQKVGIAAFGRASRVTMYLPALPNVSLFPVVGMPVQAGRTVLARIEPE